MKRAVLVLLVLVAPLLAGAAAAEWTLGPGVTLETPNVLLTFAENATTLDDDLTFESTTGPVVLDGFTLDFQPRGGAEWAWDVLNFSLPTLFVFTGDNDAQGRLEVEGLNGIYEVSGVLGFDDFQVSHPHYNFSIPAGEQTITMQPASTGDPFEWPTVEYWFPIILWGALFGLFLYHSAWAPASGALLALAVALLPDPIWTTTASVMGVAVLLFLHTLATKGIIPLPWGREP